MKSSIAAKLAQLGDRLIEVNRLLSNEDATRDMDSYRKLHRERAELAPVVALYHTHQACAADIATAQEMMNDPELREFAEDEVKQGRERLQQVEEDLQKQLLPKDPNDERNIFLEIRAGTGGEKQGRCGGEENRDPVQRRALRSLVVRFFSNLARS